MQAEIQKLMQDNKEKHQICTMQNPRKCTPEKRKTPFFLSQNLYTKCNLGGNLGNLEPGSLASAKNRLHNLARSYSKNRKKGITQTVGALVATLKPNTGTVRNTAGSKTDAIVTSNLQNACGLLILGLHEPPVLGHRGLDSTSTLKLGKKGVCALEYIKMGTALVTSGADNQIHVEELLVDKGSLLLVLLTRNVLGESELKLVALLVDIHNLATTHDAVRPLGLIGSKGPLLVVHLVVQLLNQLEADDTVVGGFGVVEEVLAVSRALGIELIDELGVEDLVNERRIVAGFEELGAHDHVSLAVEVGVLNVAENLGGTLSSSNDSHAVGS